MNLREAGLGWAMCGVFAALLVWLNASDLLYEITGGHGTWAFKAVMAALYALSLWAIFALAMALRRQQLEPQDARSKLKFHGTRSDETSSSVNRRIAELEERNRALSISERRFRDFVEAASDRFWELDTDLRFCYISDPEGTVVEPSASALIGKRRWELVGGDPERDSLWAFHKAEMESHRPFEDFRYHHLRRDGTKRHWSVSGRPVFDSGGLFLGYRGWSKDITPAVEQELALKAAAKDAEIANSAKSEFLANMSHELRTPLNAIIGFSQIIKDNTLGPNAAKYRDYATDIHESGQHLLELINDILDLSKIESGKDELHEDLVDIADVVAASGRLVQARAMDSKVALVYELQGGAPSVHGDARKLKQIVVNLLSNAIKFSNEGSMVTVKTKCEPEQGFVIQIQDRGIGMAPDEIPTALSIFGQLDAGPDRNCDGTGLGLPLAKALAEQHGGGLELESQPGEGTTVIVRLPAERMTAPVPKPENKVPLIKSSA